MVNEFRDVCLQIKKICQTHSCSVCPFNDAPFCKIMPGDWTETLMDKMDEVMAMLQSCPTIGQYLEERGLFSADDDDEIKLQALYQTKVPMEWLR